MKPVKSIAKCTLSILLAIFCFSGCEFNVNRKYDGWLEILYTNFAIEIPLFTYLYHSANTAGFEYYVYSTEGFDELSFIEKNNLKHEKNATIEQHFDDFIEKNRIDHELYPDRKYSELIPPEYVPDYNDDYCWRFISSEKRYRYSDNGKIEYYYVYEEDVDKAFDNKVDLLLDIDKHVLYVRYWVN
ncbi:MAG: hypothetical protein IJ811_04360 [Clostridia bacterium]|nr:hypothetical protein [Clostridia bacterium]